MIRLIFKKVLPFLLIISMLPSCGDKEDDQAAALQYQVSEFAGEAGFAEPVKMVMDYSKNRIIVIDNRSGNGNGSDNSSDISSDNGSHDGNGNGNSSSNSSGKGNSFPTLVYLDSSGKPTTEVMLPVNGDCSVIAMDLNNNVNILEQEHSCIKTN